MEEPAGAVGRLVWRIAGAVFAMAVLVGLFVIWWLAVLVALGVFAIWAIRRLFTSKAATPKTGPTIIEGEYSVEPERPPAASDPSDRIPARLPPGR